LTKKNWLTAPQLMQCSMENFRQITPVTPSPLDADQNISDFKENDNFKSRVYRCIASTGFSGISLVACFFAKKRVRSAHPQPQQRAFEQRPEPLP
jgi:hypothetical protein